MRTIKVGICVLVLLVLCTCPTRAQTLDELYREQLEASGGEALFHSLPEETLELLRRLKIDSLQSDTFTEMDTNSLIRELWVLFKEVAGKPLAACGTVLGILLIYAWVDGMRQTLRTEEVSSVFGVICSLAACGSVMLPMASQLERVSEAMKSVSVFMSSFVPVYAGILVSGGQLSAAVSFQSIVLYAAELLSWVAGSLIVPLLSISLALGLTGSLTPELKLGRVGAMTGKTAAWLLTLGMVLFTGVLSLQTFVGGAADKLSDRALRFSIAHFVPVVGGSISEAFSTIRGCLHLLRSTVGCFGVAATLVIVLPPLLSCLVWNVMLSIGEMAAELFGLPSFSELLKTAHGIIRCLVGVLCVSGLLLTVSLTVITVAAGGTT